jgi:hypothetical protein
MQQLTERIVPGSEGSALIAGLRFSKAKGLLGPVLGAVVRAVYELRLAVDNEGVPLLKGPAFV